MLSQSFMAAHLIGEVVGALPRCACCQNTSWEAHSVKAAFSRKPTITVILKTSASFKASFLDCCTPTEAFFLNPYSPRVQWLDLEFAHEVWQEPAMDKAGFPSSIIHCGPMDLEPGGRQHRSLGSPGPDSFSRAPHAWILCLFYSKFCLYL